VFLAVAIGLVAWLIPAIHMKNFGTAIVVAIVYSLINFFLGWLFLLLSFPFMILTLGLFKIVINAFMLWITDKIIKDFSIDNFGWTVVAAVLISSIDMLLRKVF
jgi:putative membrane protein